jgi:hypothetical protein
MIFSVFKQLLPNKPIRLRVLRGPFRGARLMMNPRNSMRKILGLYEHELNRWLEEALHYVNRVIDVGANDGYFSFGCAAAFRRLGKEGTVLAIESQDRHVQELRHSLAMQKTSNAQMEIVHALVGRELKLGMITLDSVRSRVSDSAVGQTTLIKIDVEGAELDVIEGARSWLRLSNLFVIEVHREKFLPELKQIFAESGHGLIQIDQRPVPFLGREDRDEKNWWLVSNLQQMGNAVQR